PGDPSARPGGADLGDVGGSEWPPHRVAAADPRPGGLTTDPPGPRSPDPEASHDHRSKPAFSGHWVDWLIRSGRGSRLQEPRERGLAFGEPASQREGPAVHREGGAYEEDVSVSRRGGPRLGRGA